MNRKKSKTKTASAVPGVWIEYHFVYVNKMVGIDRFGIMETIEVQS